MTKTKGHGTARRGTAIGLIGFALLVGCSGSDASTGVASLSGSGESSVATDGGTELTEEKALEFSQCMRDNGVEDFPDPTVDADGNVQLGGGGPGAGAADGASPRQDEDFQTAQEACGSLLDGLTFGGGRGGPGGGFDNTELQDALVAFSDCLRDEGLDVGDITFGPPPDATGNGTADGATEGSTAPQAPPAAGERGPGGDPSQRMIESLGLDPDDPAVQAALEKCQPLLDDAFSNFGPNAAADTDSGDDQ
jgi:hypothetical protein